MVDYNKIDYNKIEENVKHYFEKGGTNNLPHPDYVIETKVEKTLVLNPFLSECMRMEVDPVCYYGESFKQSNIYKDCLK